MLELSLPADKKTPLKILCLGAHSDDIEIGCGGTILKLLNNYKNSEVHWVVFSAIGARTQEAEKSARQFLVHAKRQKIVTRKYKDGYFPYVGGEIKTFFEGLKKTTTPHLIFTHYRNDFHQDHRLISELTWNTFRDHLILEYEVVKYDGDLGNPNFYINLDNMLCNKKVEIIAESFKSQGRKNWFGPDTFYAIMRLRGIESRAPEKYAEAFYCRKTVLKW